MTDAKAIIQKLSEANPLREPTLRSIIRSLQLPRGSHGLDAGCGIGLQALLLAEAAGPGGHVTGLDILPELLTYAEDLASKAGLSERVAFRLGDVSCLPFEDDSFDWAWSADCIGQAWRQYVSAGMVLPTIAARIPFARSAPERDLLGVYPFL